MNIIYDPEDPVPSLGGKVFWSGAPKAMNFGAYDQRKIEIPFMK